MRRALAASCLGLVLVGCGGGSDSMVSPQKPVTLLDVQTQVLTPRCALSGCHVAPIPPFGLDMSSVANSQANLVGFPSGEIPSLLRVNPGDSASSYMYMKITGAPGINGDQMPASGGPLSAGDVQLIQRWIDQGAK